MKITAVLGSGRKDSTSEKIVEEILRGAREAGHEIVTYDVGRTPILGCQGCGACKKATRDCVQKDALQPYWADLHSSDVLIVSAPNYFGQTAGQMITYQNRHYCLMDLQHNCHLEPGKRVIGVFTQGAPAGYADYEKKYAEYMGIFQHFGMENAGMLVAGTGTDVSPEGELMRKAYALGKSL